MMDLSLLRQLKREAYIDSDAVERFMVESNRIEAESGLNPNDLRAARKFLRGPLTARALLRCHDLLAEPRNVDWGGRWRECGVRVGKYVAPPAEEVPGLMRLYFRNLPALDSWEAHNRFEKIHPFEDLNGRSGRLIWLHRALDEGYGGERAFLHEFYYATLRHQPDLQA